MFGMTPVFWGRIEKGEPIHGANRLSFLHIIKLNVIPIRQRGILSGYGKINYETLYLEISWTDSLSPCLNRGVLYMALSACTQLKNNNIVYIN